MATLIKNRCLQYPLVAVFEFDIASGDVMVNTSGVSQTFKATTGTFDVIALPVNSQVIGGDLVVETASNDSSTATLSVGDSGSATRYLGATSIKSAARTALVPTGFMNSSGLDIRITLANASGDATAGKVRLHVTYVVKNRQNETQIA